MQPSNIMAITHTVLVPVRPTTRAGTNPQIFARVQSPSLTSITFLTDPQSEQAVDRNAYDPEVLDYAERTAADAVRACALDPTVTTTPGLQISQALPQISSAPGE